MPDRYLGGWRVASLLDLPELPVWMDDQGEPDLVIRIGRVSDRLADCAWAESRVKMAPDGACTLSVGGVGAYLVDAAGHNVTVDPTSGADPRHVRAILLGSVFGILCHRRDLLPLHASCVEIDGHAVAFTGPSGIGKSTLAAAFAAAGHRVLADDVTVIDLDAPNGPLVRPTISRLKLRGDSLRHLQLEGGAGLRADGPFEMEKYHMAIESAFSRQPMRLAALYHLGGRPTASVEAARLIEGIEMLRAVTGAVFRLTAGRAVRGAGVLFSSVARLSALVPSYAMAWPSGFSDLAADVRRLCARHAGRAV
jgi:hypothetical protein